MALFWQVLRRPGLLWRCVSAATTRGQGAPVSFDRDWNVPQELRRSSPREIQLTTPGMVAVAAVIGAALVAAALINSEWASHKRQVSINERLRHQGSVAPGKVVALSRTKAGLWVQYRFRASGIDYQGAALAAPNAKTLSVRGPIAVRFVAADPQVNYPADWEAETFRGAVVMLALLCISGCLFGGYQIRLQASLLANGAAAQGVVTGTELVKGEWRVRYQFRTPDGRWVKGSGHSHAAPALGGSVCVLYLSDAPRRSRIYPLGCYRLQQGPKAWQMS